MNAEQYKHLLQDLARVSGLADPASLVGQGRVRVGDLNAVLEHDPHYDENLLQLRFMLGRFPPEGTDALAKALLEANYISGYGGECVFSLFPESDDVVITMRLRLEEGMTAQELWQEISDVARQGSEMWERVVAQAGMTQGALLPELAMR